MVPLCGCELEGQADEKVRWLLVIALCVRA